jgi:hypothetical protein
MRSFLTRHCRQELLEYPSPGVNHGVSERELNKSEKGHPRRTGLGSLSAIPTMGSDFLLVQEMTSNLLTTSE